MNGRRVGILTGVFMLCALNGCAAQKETVSTTADAAADTTEEQPETYSFVDVAGNLYEALLLEDVARCSYDSDRLTDENGYKYYTDRNGAHVSSLGIDVSEFQNTVDWAQVKSAGIEFAIIRVGYRGYGQEGKLVEDARFRENIEGAVGAGIEVGVYFFSQAVSKEETLEEAQFVLERIKEYPVSCPVVFDTEEIKNDTARTDGLSREQFTENCITFCDAVEDAGYRSMIYANMKWLAFTLELEELEGYDKWYADYEPVPQCPYAFAMWQYTEEGRVPGIETNVDLNVGFPVDKESGRQYNITR